MGRLIMGKREYHSGKELFLFTAAFAYKIMDTDHIQIAHAHKEESCTAGN